MFDDSIQIAKELLRKGELRSCVYACLELRFAIERHVYNKINFYTKRYGGKQLYSVWQPNKALRILCQLEPLADQSYEISYSHEKKLGVPSGNWKSLGKHEALTSKWVTKNYNKLGHYLHRNASGDLPDLNELTAYISEVVKELERVESSSLMSSFAETISFNCSLCDQKITCCVSALPDLPEIVCSNMKCKATYFTRKNESGQWGFTLDSVSFECSECKQEKNILTGELGINTGWKCNNCGARYQIVGHTWNYMPIDS